MPSVLQRAADATACQMLNDIGSASTQLAAWTMWNPKVALVPLTIGGLSYMANNLLCQDMPFPDWPEDPSAGIDGCAKLEEGAEGKIMFKPCENESDPLAYCSFAPETNVNEILGVSTEKIPNNPNLEYTVRFKLVTGEERSASQIMSPGTSVYILPLDGGSCVREGGDLQPTPDFPPYQYTDPQTNCNYTLKLEGFVQQYENGPAEPVWNIRSADSARADGGRMGACNLSPTIYIGGDGSGGDGIKPPQFPVPPLVPPDGPDGVPWWLPPLVGATTGALLNQIGRVMNDTFNYPMEPGGFDLVAPCDFDAEGENESRQWAFPKTPLILRLHDHQVAMMEIMQQHLNWKTPTCNDNAKPPLEGQWVTTRWKSTEKMAHSGRRLRKLFRYRTKSSRDLGQLSAYWAEFSWQSGDVCVIHKGAWWGTPQVWAESEAEGQRVIRFAAAEAGIDPDQVGEWTISSSRSPRYGMSGTMTIELYEGVPWISSRESASFPNVLALNQDP